MTTPDVWQFESKAEVVAAQDLNIIITQATEGNRKAQNYLRKLWGSESWQSIKSKLAVEGSVWYVWYMDGVRKHLMSVCPQK